MIACINGATTMKHSVEDDIRAAGRAGFDAVELWTTKFEAFFVDHPKEDLRKLAEDAGVKVAGMCPLAFPARALTQQEMDDAKALAEIGQMIGAKFLLGYVPRAGFEGAVEDARKNAADTVARIAEIAGEFHMDVSVEPIGLQDLVPGPGIALDILREAGNPPNARIMIDTFHYTKSEVPFDDVLALHADQISVVHINDCPAMPVTEREDKHRVWPLEGALPLVEYIRILRSMGYDGPLSLELFNEAIWQQDPDRVAGDGLRALRALLAKA